MIHCWGCDFFFLSRILSGGCGYALPPFFLVRLLPALVPSIFPRSLLCPLFRDGDLLLMLLLNTRPDPPCTRTNHTIIMVPHQLGTLQRNNHHSLSSGSS